MRSLKKSFIIFLIFFIVFFSFGQNKKNTKNNLVNKETGFVKWISDIGEEKDAIGEYKVIEKQETQEGFFFRIKKERIEYSISLVTKIPYKTLVTSIEKIENELKIGKENSFRYGKITIEKVEIIFGSASAMITPEIKYLSVIWNDQFTVDLKDKVEIVFNYNFNLTDKNAFTHETLLKGERINDAIGDVFLDWEEYFKSFYFFLEEGFLSKNEKIAYLINSSVFFKDSFKPQRRRSTYWLSVSNQSSTFDSRVNNKSILCGSLRRIGAKDWIFKPFNIDIYNGFFLEADFGYAIKTISSPHAAFRTLGFVNFGGSTGIGFAVGIPKFKYKKSEKKFEITSSNEEILRLGYEFFLNVNINKDNDYFFNVEQLFTVYLFPDKPTRVDFFVGLSSLIYDKETGVTGATHFLVGYRWIIFDGNIRDVLIQNK
ncbi:MAG TPA: hypothetical protein PLO89_00230 [Spirochaetota bacterium]|nr:hypothetical protein [Spirochaetota bacterium]